ncbi:hypothetical protein L873DRAFT_1845586 [Choiromyces venosus 120613-1]|uniref:Uncharacterized protein n=1 Tax=Choiromyces venosus 120613-1 TaxID=1336337 RepID=A0A3N4JCU1_9PEZI|nr:hypothetical protein L873DRAFT_1845586 [Choiromyces venosus 120613-1]
MALKKMHHYNKRKPVGAQSGMAMTSESTSNTLEGPSIEEVEAARLKQQEKAEKEKATTIKKAQKNIQIAVNKAKASLNCHGVAAHKAEKARKQQVKAIQIRGEIVPAEMLVTIPDPERDPSPEDLESLQAPPDLLQALLLQEPTPASATSTIDLQLLGLDFEEEDIEIYTTRREAEQRYTTESASGENSFTVDDGEDLTGESDSDSSCISSDSIIRNANFVSLN